MKWYHGTSKQNAEKILKEGVLKPGEHSVYREDVPRYDAVYLTSDYQIAKFYSEERGKGGVVLEVAVNENKLMPDEDSIYDALHEGAVSMGGVANKKLGQAIRNEWFKYWKSIEGAGDTFEEAWEAWGEVEAEGSSGIAEEMKALTEEIHEKNPALSKAIIKASGKAAHIGPAKVVGIAKAAAKKVKVVKTPGFVIEVPKERRTKFFIRPKAPLEYWAFKNRPRVFINEPLIFTFNGKPVAQAMTVRVEAPGKGEGEYKHYHKVYWKPTSFRKFKVVAAKTKLYHGSREKFEPGTILTPQAGGYVHDSDAAKIEAIMEKYRPESSLPRKDSVFMVNTPKGVEPAGGYDDYIYEVEPIGKIEKNGLGWYGDVSVYGEYQPDDPEVIQAAKNYWSGEQHNKFVLWEYRAPKAKVIRLVSSSKTALLKPKETMKTAGDLLEDPDYYMVEGCGIYALDFARKNGGEIYILSAVRGEEWSEEIPYEVTHAFVKKDGKTYDIRGERTPDKMAWELSMGEYTVKGPWTPDEFEAKFVGETDDKPLYGKSAALGDQHHHADDIPTPLHTVPQRPAVIDWYSDSPDVAGAEPELIDIDPKTLLTDQDTVSKSHLDKILEHMDKINDPTPGTSEEHSAHPLVLGTSEGDFIFDGNHRCAAALLKDVTIKVLYIDLSPIEDWVPEHYLGEEGESKSAASKLPKGWRVTVKGEKVPGSPYPYYWGHIWRDNQFYGVCGVGSEYQDKAREAAIDWAWTASGQPRPKTAEDKIIDVGDGDKYWAGEGNAASGILPVCPQKGTVCLAWRSKFVMSPHCWGTIGGAVQEGRSPQESAKIEMKEEIGYTGGITLIPAYVFTDRGFSYHNFIGVTAIEFPLSPKPYSKEYVEKLKKELPREKWYQTVPGWETESIAWVPYQEVLADMEKNSGDYHPGLLKLFQNSKDAIERALKIEPPDEQKQASSKIAWQEISIEEKDPEAEDPLKGNLLGGILQSNADLKAWADHELDLPPKRERQRRDFVKKFYGKKMAVIDDMRVFDRNKGWGTKLVSQFIEKAKAAGCDGIILQAGIYEDQQKGFDLVQWYEKLGFKAVGHSGELPLMVKWLKPQGKQSADEEIIKSTVPQIEKPYIDEAEWQRINKWLISLQWRGRNPWYPAKFPWFAIRLFSDGWVARNDLAKEELADGKDLASLKKYLSEFAKEYHTSLEALRTPPYKTIDMPTNALTKSGAGVMDSRKPCPSGKRKFYNELSAIGPHKVWDPNTPPLRAYQCPKCGWWHLTSKPQKFAAEHVYTPQEVEAYFRRVHDDDADLRFTENYTLKTVAVKDLVHFTNIPADNPRVAAYMEKYKEGSPFPPVILNSKMDVRDGSHRVSAAIWSGLDTVQAFVPVKTASVKTAAKYYHGGGDVQGGMLDVRKGQTGAIFVTPDLDYAKSYVKTNGGGLYTVDVQGNIFDPENPNHIEQLEQGYLNLVGEDYDDEESALSDYGHFVSQSPEMMMDWAVAPDAFDAIKTLGYAGMRMRERPGKVTGQIGGGFNISGEPIESIALFAPKVPATRIAANHTPDYAQKLVEALKRTVHDADFKVIGSVGAGGTSENDLDILVTVHPNAAVDDEAPWVETSGLVGAMKLMGFDYIDSQDFSPEESAEKSEASGKYLNPAGSGIEKFFNPTTIHTVEFWFTDMPEGVSKEGSVLSSKDFKYKLKKDKQQWTLGCYDLAGQVAGNISIDPHVDEGYVEISYTYVKPAYRKLGIALEMYRTLFREAKESGLVVKSDDALLPSGVGMWRKLRQEFPNITDEGVEGENLQFTKAGTKFPTQMTPQPSTTEHPNVMYHYGGPEDRASIQKSGLLGSMSSALENAVFLDSKFTPEAEGKYTDIWEVNVKGLELDPDWTTDISNRPEWEGNTWWIFYGDIPPRRLKLVHKGTMAKDAAYDPARAADFSVKVENHPTVKEIFDVRATDENGEWVGSVSVRQKGKDFYVGQSHLIKSTQGIGLGSRLYAWAADEAERRGGKRLWSDTEVSIEAQRIWERLPNSQFDEESGRFWMPLTSTKTAAKTYLYHGTFKSKLPGIMKHGLGGAESEASYPQSKKGLVYLASDPLAARHWALGSDNAPTDKDGNIDSKQIVVLQIDESKLDQTKLDFDENIRLPEDCPECGTPVLRRDEPTYKCQWEECNYEFEGDISYQYAGIIPPSTIRIAKTAAAEWKKLPPTAEWIEKAKLFLRDKWAERHKELGREGVPTDLQGACKFASLFAHKLFGGKMVGTAEHQALSLGGGKMLDLTDIFNPNTFKHDKEFWMNPEHEESMKSCEPRVQQWVDEFYQKYWQDYFKNLSS